MIQNASDDNGRPNQENDGEDADDDTDPLWRLGAAFESHHETADQQRHGTNEGHKWDANEPHQIRAEDPPRRLWDAPKNLDAGFPPGTRSTKRDNG